MNLLGPSWRTTLTGVAAVLAAVAHIVDGLANGTPIDWTSSIASLTAGIGLICARDNKVTSEQVGVK